MNDNELRDKLQKEWYEKAREARKNAVLLEEIENADQRGAYRNGWQDGANWAYKLAIEETLQLREVAKKLSDALDRLLFDTQHVNHDCGDEDCPVVFAQRTLDDYIENFMKEEEK